MNVAKITQKKDFEKALEIFNTFKKKEGSKHIATPLSIQVVRMLAKRSKKILEIGSGIGTLSYTILANSDVWLTMYEDNAFCIGELKKNLREFYGRSTLITSYTKMPPEQYFDLVIVDGGNGQEHDGGYKKFIFDLFSTTYPKVIYIEGVRRPQRRMIRDALRGRFVLRTKKVRYSGAYKGGTLYYCYRAPSIVCELSYRWNQFREHPRFEKYFGRIKPPKAQ